MKRPSTAPHGSRFPSWDELKRTLPTSGKTSGFYLKRNREREQRSRESLLKELKRESEQQEKEARRHMNQMNAWCVEMHIDRKYIPKYMPKSFARNKFACEVVSGSKGGVRESTIISIKALRREHAKLSVRRERAAIRRKRARQEEQSLAPQSPQSIPSVASKYLSKGSSSATLTMRESAPRASLEDIFRSLIKERAQTVTVLESQAQHLRECGWNAQK